MTPEIYKAIRDRIREKFPTEYIDLYLEQYDDTAQNPMWTTSAWLIEFLPIEWQEQGKEVQGGIMDFIVHHVSETAYDDERRMTGMTHWAKDADLFKTLNKWACTLAYIGIDSSDPLITTIQRKSSEMLTRMSSLIVTKQRFSSFVYDFSATKQYSEVLADIRLTISLVNVINFDTNESDTTIVELAHE